MHFVRTVYVTHLGLCYQMCHCKIYVTGYVVIVTRIQHVHLISCICSCNTTKLRDVHVCLLYAFMAWCSSTNIVIIIWHYNPLWVFAFSAKSLQVLLSLAVSFQFLIFSLFTSSMTSSCHHCLDLPTGLVPIGFHSNSFLVGLAWSIL